MPLSDHVRVQVRRVRSTVSRAGFGTLLSLGAHRLFEDRYRAFSNLKALQDAGSGPTDAEERAALAYFGQNPAPISLGIGRRDTADTVDVSVVDVKSSASYKVKVAGLLHVISSPPAATTAMIVGALVRQIAGGYEITVVSTGSKKFTIGGDHVDEFPVGGTFNIRASTGNDGTYTVVSATLVTTTTEIVVSETVPSATADGHIDGYAIIGASSTAETFTVTGDLRARFPAGLKFGVKGSTGNDNAAGTPWVVESTSLLSGNTVIKVVGNVTSSVADGGIVSFADGATAQDEIGADVVAAKCRLAPDTAASFYTVALFGESKLRLAFTTTSAAATDLASVRAANDKWYGLMMTSRLLADVLGVAAVIETLPRIFATASSDAAIVDTADSADDALTGSIAARLKGLVYARSMTLYSGSNNVGTGVAANVLDAFPDAALFGRLLPTQPGSTTLNLHTLVGIVADDLTDTQHENALAKNCNIYANITDDAAGLQQGKDAEGEFIDIIRGIDWFHARLEERIFGTLQAASIAGSKVPYDKDGIAIIAGLLHAQFEEGIVQKVIAKDPPYEVTSPDILDVSVADKTARILRNVDGRGTLLGAIHEVDLLVEVSV